MQSVSLVRVLADGEVLELQRHQKDSSGRAWDLPGGHAEKQESPDRTAARELKEETGISVRPATLQMVKSYTRPDGKLFYVFELRTVEKPPVRLSSEHSGYRWTADNAELYGRA